MLFLLGLIPFIWYHPGFTISNGDNIPAFLNPQKTFATATAMWSPDYLGYASPTPSFTLYNYLGAFFEYLGFSVGFTQILLQVLLYMGAGFSMYLLSRTLYPNHRVAWFFAAFFYLFNFFIIDSRFNLGFAWLYTFLPLLLALFVRVLNAAYSGQKKSLNIGVILFALVSVAGLSVASVNPANIALSLFALAVFFIYYLVKYRKNLLPLFKSIGKLAVVTIPVNVWWLYPMLNTFLFSPTGLSSQVSIDSWAWTHARSSFLNLFWFNGTWGWLPDYVQQSVFNYYKNPIVVLVVFIPFAIGALALFFKGSRARFNVYIMACILAFIFLASGVHDPIVKYVNIALYNLPLASMFREPASKFTLLVIPFLALLVGYSAQSLFNAKSHIKPKTLRLVKASLLLLLSASFIIASLPVLDGSFIETKSEQIPASSYVTIPQYWTEAANWINQQPGDWKVLLTPLNDFYQLPYTWGYYGSDQLLERFFQKPIISTEALNGYVTSADTYNNLKVIQNSVQFNNTAEFKTTLDLFGIKYIIQRNDVNSSFTRLFSYYYPETHENLTDVVGRNLVPQSDMKTFLSEQPYLKLVNSFGQLDVYEYLDAKPSIYALSQSTLNNAKVDITTIPFESQTWDHNSNNPSIWQNFTTSSNSSIPYNVSQYENSLLISMQNNTVSNTTSSWITLTSPWISAEPESTYRINANVNATNDVKLNLVVAEYSGDKNLISNLSITRTFWDFNDTIAYSYTPKNSTIRYFTVQFKNLYNDTTSAFYLDSLNIAGSKLFLEASGLDYLYSNMNQNPGAIITDITTMSPEKFTVTVNASEPFILATNQVLDRFWVAHINGQTIPPTTTYLGLKGFAINQTGEFTVTVEYPPQTWFNYGLAISITTALILIGALLFLNRQNLVQLIKRKTMTSQVGN